MTKKKQASSKKTIFVYSTHKSWGGSEKYWFETINHPHFLDRFSPSVMLHVDPSTSPIGEKLSKAGVPVYFYQSALDFWKIILSLFFYPLRKLGLINKNDLYYRWFKRINSVNPELVWFNISGANALVSESFYHGINTCRKNNTPYWLVFQHMREDFLPSEKTLKQIESILVQAKRVVFVSQKNRFTLERAIGRRLNNAVVTQNSIQNAVILQAGNIAANSPPSTSGKVHFLHLGQFTPGHKGQHLLFEVLSQQKWIDRSWDLTLLGGGEYSRIERLRSFFNLPKDRIIIPGFTSDVLSEIAKTDLLIMPSLSEGTPFAMVECMACGRPSVGTPVGGIPELIKDGITGWIAASLEPIHIDAALEKAWNNRHLWPEMGLMARQLIIDQYNQDNTIVQVVNWLEHDCL